MRKTGLLDQIIRVLFFTIICVLFILSGCEKSATEEQNDWLVYTSFRDVPGITRSEIAAIEQFQQQSVSFTYGTTPTTEAFRTVDGEIKGFTALFCEWLTGFFGIPFVPEIYSWGDLVSGIQARTIDFTGELTATEERLKTYIMTGAIAERAIKSFRISKSVPLAEIALARPLRYVFLEGTTTVNAVLPSLIDHGPYEIIFIDNSDHAYDLLKSGQADAFINEGPGEASFDIYGDVVTSEYFPLIYEPVSMTTQNPALEPVISVVQKMLRSGGIRYLTDLYNQGYHEYTKHKLVLLLTDEERAYIASHPVIPVAAETEHYPVSFYNKRDNAFEGIFIDMLDEITLLTDLSFNIANDGRAEWPVVYRMLENGEAAFVSELIWSEEREGRFIWPSTAILLDNYSLISRMDHRTISINEILYVKVGLAKDTAYAAMFKYWFPNHMNTIEYESMQDAFDALEKGEVEMVMASLNRLLHLTNYQELPGYKANVVFESTLETKLGFNRNEAILCSIIDKALRLIDVKVISDQWMRRTYDYRVKVAQAQRPWLIGAGVMLFNVLVLTFVLLMRNRSEGRRLENLVAKRTSELKVATQDLEIAVRSAQAASLAKSQFLANMSHEIRTPMNAILGITEILLDNQTFNPDTEEALNKIYNSGDLLLNIINDILDLSKIEAGKLELLPTKYDIASLINDTVTLNMMRFESKPIEFKLEVNENVPAAMLGDELRIKQILNNLLSNAAKYTKSGEVVFSVNAEFEKESDDVILIFKVRDTGQGMSKEQVDVLFDEYTRFNMEANRATEGTGLGMSITWRLIHMMNGEIIVESMPGKGSVFFVRIPQGNVGAEALGKEVAENLRQFRSNSTLQRKNAQMQREPMPYGSVLVVDDTEANLYVAKGLMAPYGLLIDTATSGFQAIDKIKVGIEYDIVFMDHMMPEMDGIETVKKIREMGYTRPIVALTANAVVGQADVFLSNGFDDFISKPIDTRQLNALLNKLIRDKQSPETLAAAREEFQARQKDAAVTGVSGASGQPDNQGGFDDPVLDELSRIEELDVDVGLSYIGYNTESYLMILRHFVEHCDIYLNELDETLKAGVWKDYSIKAHALKGVLATIGVDELSKWAAKLEKASKEGEAFSPQTCQEETQPFSARLEEFNNKLRQTSLMAAPSEASGKPEGTPAFLKEQILFLKDACIKCSFGDTKKIIAALNEYDWGADTEKALEKIQQFAVSFDYDKALEEIEKLS